MATRHTKVERESEEGPCMACGYFLAVGDRAVFDIGSGHWFCSMHCAGKGRGFCHQHGEDVPCFECQRLEARGREIDAETRALFRED